MRWTGRRRIGSALVVCSFVWACGEGEKPVEPAPAPAPAAVPAPAPDHDAAAKAERPPDPAAGAKSYATFCVPCHGAKGDADTEFAKTLKPPPTAHSNGAYMNSLSDDYLFRIIKEGGFAVGKAPVMPAWGGSLSDEEIRDVVAFVRTLAVPPYQPPAPGTSSEPSAP